MLDVISKLCPYCNQPIELVIDGSIASQHYTEDCQVCCRPMVVTTCYSGNSAPDVQLSREDD